WKREGALGRLLHRHARPCAGHPRLILSVSKTWMAGTSPAMTVFCEVKVGGLRYRFLGLDGALAIGGVQKLFTQADRFRGHFDQLVVLDIGQRLFQRHPDRRG